MKTRLHFVRAVFATGAAIFLTTGLRAQQTTDVWVSGSNPPATIKLRIDGIVVANGTYNSGTTSLPTEATGAAVRMLWYPGKAAFRAGESITINSGYQTSWDDSLIGRYSFAVGYNPIASGQYSFAAGSNAKASGYGSIAMGVGATTGDDYSGNDIAIGSSAQTSYGGVAIGPSAFSHYGGVALGSSVSGSYGSVALGKNVSSEFSSTAIGHFSIANNYSTALGSSNLADGKYATALGYFTTARAYGSTVVGQFNTVQGNPAQPVLTDPVFVVGNGTASYSRSDAFIVYQSGNAALAGTLSVNGSPVLTANSGGGITLSGGDRVITIGTPPASIGGILTLKAGDANPGAGNANGGGLILSSGASTGTGFSAISFKTAPASTSGTVNQPVERMTINSNGRVGIGVTNPASALDVAGDIRASGSLIEKTIAFTPTAAGWYRIAQGSNVAAGTVRISGNFDGPVTNLEFQFSMGGYGNDGSIQLTRWLNFNGSNIEKIRLGCDGGSLIYLDVYIPSVANPLPLTVDAYGRDMLPLIANPQGGAVPAVANGYAKSYVLAVGHGFRTTQGGSFAGNVGAGVSAPAARMDIASIGGTDALRVRTQTDTAPSTPFRITADGKVLVKKQGDISMGGFMAGTQP